MEMKYSDFFQLIGGAQGYTLLPTLFLIYIKGLLSEIEKCKQLGIKFSDKMFGLLFAGDFVGLAETGPELQSNYSKYWCFEVNEKGQLQFFQN